MGRAYLQIGCDPRGGIATQDAVWIVIEATPAGEEAR